MVLGSSQAVVIGFQLEAIKDNRDPGKPEPRD